MTLESTVKIERLTAANEHNNRIIAAVKAKIEILLKAISRYESYIKKNTDEITKITTI
jgi:hypothetical protein